MQNRKSVRRGRDSVYEKTGQRNLWLGSGLRSNAETMIRRTKHIDSGYGHRQAGFTLIELVIVLVVLGVLGGIVTSRLSGLSNDAEAKALADSINAAASRVLLSENLSPSDFNDCADWSSNPTRRDQIASFVEGLTYTTNGNNVNVSRSQKVSLPDGLECTVEFSSDFSQFRLKS